MDSVKVLLSFAMILTIPSVVNACLPPQPQSLNCYTCNSQNSPLTCNQGNFNASVHAYDTTRVSAGTSCVRGWTANDKGIYYYRDKSSEYEDDGCKTHTCYCNSNLCNSKGSPVLFMTTITTTIFSSFLGIAHVQKIFV